VLALDRVGGVERAGAANRAANFGAIERFVDDLANGASAPPTLGATAKTTIDVACRPARRSAGSGSHLLIAQYVAGTDNHPGIR